MIPFIIAGGFNIGVGLVMLFLFKWAGEFRYYRDTKRDRFVYIEYQGQYVDSKTKTT